MRANASGSADIIYSIGLWRIYIATYGSDIVNDVTKQVTQNIYYQWIVLQYLILYLNFTKKSNLTSRFQYDFLK